MKNELYEKTQDTRCFLCPKECYKGMTFEYDGRDFCSQKCENKFKKNQQNQIPELICKKHGKTRSKDGECRKCKFRSPNLFEYQTDGFTFNIKIESKKPFSRKNRLLLNEFIDSLK